MTNRRPKMEHILSPAYLRAIGNVIAQWAYFEMEFDACTLNFFGMHPKVKPLVKIIPSPFNKRLRLFRDAASICFEGTAAIVRFGSIADEARRVKTDRDEIAHGVWIKGRDEIGVRLVRFGDWNRAKTQVWPIKSIKRVGDDIGYLSAELMTLTRVGMFLSPNWLLTSDEISAIRVFRTNNLPKLPKLDIRKLQPPPSQARS